MQTLLNFLKLISATKEKSDFGSFVDNLGSRFVYFACILTEFLFSFKFKKYDQECILMSPETYQTILISNHLPLLPLKNSFFY